MISDNLKSILDRLPQGVRLVAVSKFHPLSAIREAYDAGQRVFGESRPQEFEAKALALPQDIEWHFIGHLQTNKLKKVLPYVAMVESVDSVHLLEAISRWGIEHGRCIDILLEMHLGAEETKQGFSEEEIAAIVAGRAAYPGVTVRGLMGMATNTPDERVVRSDFARIAAL
ncbi:MAG: YggS family pyridoxal phosphate enzyme, partial [Bacteroidales bacterium]|nr:YggS family pyridoxal phosphate enzyme [Bacteroidales bacterium]